MKIMLTYPLDSCRLQFLDMFLKYKDLIQRHRIRNELKAECQTLMASLNNWIDALKASLSLKTRHEIVPEVPDTLQEIYMVRRLETQVTKMPIHPFLSCTVKGFVCTNVPFFFYYCDDIFSIYRLTIF